MTRRWIALLVAVTLTATSCSSGDGAGSPDDAVLAISTKAALEFERAVQIFDAELSSARALDGSTLASRTASTQGVRAAYAGLDTATRAITFPDALTEDRDDLLGALGALGVALDTQGAATTLVAFEAAGPDVATAMRAADAAIESLSTQLGVLASGATPDTPGSTSSAGEPQSTQTPLAPHYVQGHEVVARKKWRDDLIDVALGNVDAAASDPSKGILPAWRAAFGSILSKDALVGADLEPSRNGVSASDVLPRRSGSPAGPGNTYYFAFAVRDASGQCAGAVLTGFPLPRKVERITVPTGALCTAAVVARTAGLT